MSATKIINVLRGDKFEELLGIVKDTEASEVIFVLPKKTKAFGTEKQFALLSKEIKDSGKLVAFLCSNPETNDLAKKYNFDTLSTKTESGSLRRVRQAQPSIVATAAKNNGTSDDDTEEIDDSEETDEEHKESENELGEFVKDEETLPEISDEQIKNEESYDDEEKDLKEEEEEAPFGTKVDDDGNVIYDEGEENIAEETASSDNTGEFQVIGAVSKKMGDVIPPTFGKNIKIIQKSKRPVKLETKIGQSGLDWNKGEESENIWSGISKPSVPRSSVFKKFKLFKNRIPKSGLLKFNRDNSQRRWIGVLSLASILILASIVFFTTGSAKINIKPRSEKLDLQLKVAISPNFASVDDSFNRIPGQLFKINKSAVDEFNATAEKDAVQKSRGTLTIYNEYGTSPQPLVATTRFEFIQEDKVSGFVFRTLQSVIVPGMKVENGIITPGKISVEVIADKAGQAYNIPAGSFGIVAWREKGDTARYEKIYGKSSEPMHGGILGKAKVVSEFDYNNAKDQLTAKVKNEINESLKSQSASLELPPGIETKIDSAESTAGIDDAADTFTVTVEGSIVTIGYKKEDLMALVTQYVDRTKDLMAVPEKLELSYTDVAINSADNTLRITVNISGNGYAKIDKEDVIGNLAGKNEAQIKDYLGSINNIDSAKVVLSPFWVKKIPRNPQRVDILLTF